MIFNELKDIILKSMNTDSDLIKKIGKLGEIELLILSGAFVGEESAVDLLIVGDINKDNLQKLLAESSKTGENLKFTSMTKRDFLYRLECKDKFIHDFISYDKSIVAVNKMKKELERIRY